MAGLVRMKLMANRDKDRVHLRDMIDVGLLMLEMRLSSVRLQSDEPTLRIVAA